MKKGMYVLGFEPQGSSVRDFVDRAQAEVERVCGAHSVRREILSAIVLAKPHELSGREVARRVRALRGLFGEDALSSPKATVGPLEVSNGPTLRLTITSDDALRVGALLEGAGMLDEPVEELFLPVVEVSRPDLARSARDVVGVMDRPHPFMSLSKLVLWRYEHESDEPAWKPEATFEFSSRRANAA